MTLLLRAPSTAVAVALPVAVTLLSAFVAAGPTSPAATAAAPAAPTSGALRPVSATPPTTGEPTAGPAVTGLLPGRLDVFEQSARDTLQQVVRPAGGRWTTTFDLGGPITSAPAAASPAHREVVVVARGAGSRVVAKVYRGGWQPFTSLGGAVDAAPAAASPVGGRVDVVVRGTNGSAYTRVWVGGTWSGWRGLGGRLASAPALAADAAGGLTLLVRGTDGVLYERRQAGGVWSARWLRVPGAPAGGVSAAGPGRGQVAAFVRGEDGVVTNSRRRGTTWDPWTEVPGTSASLPGAHSPSTGALDVLARGTDGLLRRISPTGDTPGAGWGAPEVVPVGLHRPVDRELSPGVRHAAFYDDAGPFAVQVATLTLASPARADTALARDRLGGFEVTSEIARRRAAVVAVNGDFGVAGGRPAHVYAEDGVLVQSTIETGYNIAIDARQTTARVGITGIERTFEHRRVRLREQTTLINTFAPTSEEYAEYTALAAGVVAPPEGTCSVALRPTGAPFLRPDGRVQQENTVEVPMVCGPVTAGEGQVLLTAPAGGRHQPFLARMLVGDEVPGTWSLAWRGLYDSLGGNPVLVQGGAVAAGNVDQPGAYFARQPRTGVGHTPDGRLLLVTVDGRQAGHSVGMTMREFAELFVRLGVSWALNLDGGGSTTMVVAGEVTNRTCCNVSTGVAEQRGVSSALLVLPGADPGETPPPPPPAPANAVAPFAGGGGTATVTRSSGAASGPWLGGSSRRGPTRLTATQRAADAATWAEVVADPGSTGGLLAATRD